ncbi:MAG: PQQ-binding-like beta-propeller repeat protein [Fuerstiella sp.]|nr:PQQ-binding-like beta-propeller repeat protein [Fuerstiella sp.]MCP4859492.1 PQQ-binding-like beta-propeller repeat protein [Fuerstiella sp.]
MHNLRSLLMTASVAAVLIVSAGLADAQQTDPATAAGLHGGLIVQLGADDTQAAAALSLTGRHLIHVLDLNADTIQSARTRLRKDGHYGLTWAEQPVDPDRLPYAENMVNLIEIRDYTVPVTELLRVLTPGGSIVVADTKVLSKSQLEAGGFDFVTESESILIARKPWPEAMDSWSHPRHGSDGNAVSGDTLVGPPDRVRWIAAATSEVEGMVTAGGRNFYGGILARDSFNGLRLWHRDLRKAENNPTDFELPRLSRDGVRPIASEGLLFAVLQNRPVALDASTGEVVVELGDMVKPNSVLHDGIRVIAADDDSLRAFDTETGREVWNVAAPGPQNIIADGAIVTFIQGRARRGEKAVAVALDAATGTVKWQRNDYPWLDRAVRTVLSNGQLVFEVSTLNDDDADNGIHVVSAATGEHRWSREYAPGMNHARQARAMFLNDDLWILHGGKINTADKENMKRTPVMVSALNPLTGETRISYPAGLTHCFPPVATPNFMFAGELDMTNLKSGEVIANRITKANCSRENGWVPANGLVYTTPKHCTCWPMLRGFVAMAPAAAEDSPANLPVDEMEFLLIKGPGKADAAAANPAPHDWPLYRRDRWRSASAITPGPKLLQKRWTTALNSTSDAKKTPTGPIMHDWDDNPVVKGLLSAPTIANGLAYVTRPNAHELIAIDTASGDVRWRFTANGRLDTPPAIHRGLCLFGSAAGWVYALKATTGEVVWKLRAAPTIERIVAYGQVESPWPVPGAVLVMDDIAYFAAGRQPLADGGILVFAVNPLTGERHWVQRINTVPQKGFYENSGLEFDPFDLLHAEGDGLAMSRWVLSPDGKDVSVDKWNAFAKLNTGAGDVWIPRGSWTYGARHQHRFPGEAPRRPLVVFRDDNVYSSLNGSTDVFRRDFDLDKGEKFDSKWITGWQASQEARKDGKPYRTYRIAEGAAWTEDPFTDPDAKKEEVKQGSQRHNRIHAMALASDDTLYVVHQDGRLKALSTSDGYVVRETQVPTPAWDGLAIAENRLYLTTQSGELVCLGQ